MKQCTKCKKLSNDFGPAKQALDGLKSWCRACCNEQCNQYHKTKVGLITKMYSNQLNSSKRRGHAKPEYSLEDLKEWCFSQKDFHELYDDWQASGHEKMLIPSCDRTDDSKGYSLDRLGLMTWRQNKQKGSDDMRSGKLVNGVNPQKSVTQLTLAGEVVEEFVSARQAARITGVNFNSISQCCLDKIKTAGKFNWEFTI